MNFNLHIENPLHLWQPILLEYYLQLRVLYVGIPASQKKWDTVAMDLKYTVSRSEEYFIVWNGIDYGILVLPPSKILLTGPSLLDNISLLQISHPN